MYLKYTLSFLILLLFAVGCQPQALQTQQEASDIIPNRSGIPNVILITISSLRADHVGIYGYDRNTTPHFDEFAENSILFEYAFASSSWQMPAVGSILTSLYPSQHGATHIERKMKQCTTLPDILKNRGYYTAGFCCNPRLTESIGFAQGYDFFDDFSVNLMLESLNFDSEDTAININQRRTNDLINDAAIRWMNKNHCEPFFLSVHYYDNHWDYLPPEPYDTLFSPDYTGPINGKLISKEPLYSNKPADEDVEQIIALYDGQVRQTDEDLGELLDFLSHSDLFKDSVIIVMGDHGEQFYEHGNTSHHGLYDELLKMPLAISFPQYDPAKYSSLVSGMDIMPTVLAYLGMPVPTQCEGKNLMPIIEGRSSDVRDYLFVEYTGGAIPDIFAARSKHFKYFQPTDSNAFGFDLTNDPGEQKRLVFEDFSEELLLLQRYCQRQIEELDTHEQEQQDTESTQ